MSRIDVSTVQSGDERWREYRVWGDEGLVFRYTTGLYASLSVLDSPMRLSWPTPVSSLLTTVVAECLLAGQGRVVGDDEMADCFVGESPWRGAPHPVRVDVLGTTVVVQASRAWATAAADLAYMHDHPLAAGDEDSADTTLNSLAIPDVVVTQLAADVGRLAAGESWEDLFEGEVATPAYYTPPPASFATIIAATRRR